MARPGELAAGIRRRFSPVDDTEAAQDRGMAASWSLAHPSPFREHRGFGGSCGVSSEGRGIRTIRTSTGWSQLPAWIDLFRRRVTGWRLDPRMDAALVIQAIKLALGHGQVAPDQRLIPTDQGIQYRVTDYRDQLHPWQWSTLSMTIGER